MGHEYQDRVSLELARTIAAGLPSHPEWVEQALGNLDRWSTINAGSPSSLRNYAEWRAILSGPIDEVIRTMLREDDEGQRLRQNSPLAGVLSAREVWEIKRRCREEARDCSSLPPRARSLVEQGASQAPCFRPGSSLRPPGQSPR